MNVSPGPEEDCYFDPERGRVVCHTRQSGPPPEEEPGEDRLPPEEAPLPPPEPQQDNRKLLRAINQVRDLLAEALKPEPEPVDVSQFLPERPIPIPPVQPAPLAPTQQTSRQPGERLQNIYNRTLDNIRNAYAPQLQQLVEQNSEAAKGRPDIIRALTEIYGPLSVEQPDLSTHSINQAGEFGTQDVDSNAPSIGETLDFARNENRGLIPDEQPLFEQYLAEIARKKTPLEKRLEMVREFHENHRREEELRLMEQQRETLRAQEQAYYIQQWAKYQQFKKEMEKAKWQGSLPEDDVQPEEMSNPGWKEFVDQKLTAESVYRKDLANKRMAGFVAWLKERHGEEAVDQVLDSLNPDHPVRIALGVQESSEGLLIAQVGGTTFDIPPAVSKSRNDFWAEANSKLFKQRQELFRLQEIQIIDDAFRFQRKEKILIENIYETYILGKHGQERMLSWYDLVEITDYVARNSKTDDDFRVMMWALFGASHNQPIFTKYVNPKNTGLAQKYHNNNYEQEQIHHYLAGVTGDFYDSHLKNNYFWSTLNELDELTQRGKWNQGDMNLFIDSMAHRDDFVEGSNTNTGRYTVAPNMRKLLKSD